MQLGSFASSGRPEELDGHPGRQHEPVRQIVARKRPKLEPLIEPPCPQPRRVDHDHPGCHMVEDGEAAVLCFCGPDTVRHASPTRSKRLLGTFGGVLNRLMLALGVRFSPDEDGGRLLIHDAPFLWCVLPKPPAR